jgi:hypothetical protein
MIYLLALFFPWLAMMFKGLIGQGILCLILQLTIIGWIPATIWAIVAINNVKAKNRHEQLMQTIQANQVYSKSNELRTMEEKARLYDEMMRK